MHARCSNKLRTLRYSIRKIKKNNRSRQRVERLWVISLSSENTRILALTFVVTTLEQTPRTDWLTEKVVCLLAAPRSTPITLSVVFSRLEQTASTAAFESFTTTTDQNYYYNYHYYYWYYYNLLTPLDNNDRPMSSGPPEYYNYTIRILLL